MVTSRVFILTSSFSHGIDPLDRAFLPASSIVTYDVHLLSHPRPALSGAGLPGTPLAPEM
jgi:hypothetical protein